MKILMSVHTYTVEPQLHIILFKMMSSLCLITSNNRESTTFRGILIHDHTIPTVDQLVFASTSLDEETELSWGGLQLFSNWDEKV